MTIDLDPQSFADLARDLQGWSGTADQLQICLLQEQHYTILRSMAPHWNWGTKAQQLVFGLVACARRRGARVTVRDHRSTFNSAILTIELPGKKIRIDVRRAGVTVSRSIDGVDRGERRFSPPEATVVPCG